MQLTELTDSTFIWMNKPEYNLKGNVLTLKTAPRTDFWQRTHYGFRNDNGHFCYTNITSDFSMSVKINANPQKQFDQCGLMVRLDSDNWIKVSSEYETETHSRLGSVVTNLGYSDWATQDVDEAVREMWYRIQCREQDFLLEFSRDGKSWKQMRIARLQKNFTRCQVGLYACSPMESSFEAVFSRFRLEDPQWGN